MDLNKEKEIIISNQLDKKQLNNNNKKLFPSIKKSISIMPICMNDVNTNDDKFEYLLNSLSKKVRSIGELQIIMNYLEEFRELNSLLKNVNGNKMEIISFLATKINVEIYERNKILFITGDKSDKFYLVIKGRLALIGVKEIKIKLSEEQYLKYLIKLRKHRELEIISKMLIANKKIFPIKNKNLEKWFKGKTLDIESSKKYEDSISEEVDDKSCCFQDYIERYKVYDDNSDNIDNKIVTLYQYTFLTDFVEGNKFGEFGLSSSSLKRTGTIITKTDCILGVISKVDFDEGLKEAADKNKKWIIEFLMNTKIFHGLDYFYLNQIFYSFLYNPMERGKKLIVEGERVNPLVYFIKSGEFECSVTCTINDINKKIKFFGGKIENEKEEIYWFNSRDESLNFYKKKLCYKLSHFLEGDVIGLDDCIENGFYSFSYECLSASAEVYELDKTFFDNLIENHLIIKKNTNELISFRKRNNVEKMIKSKDKKIEFFQMMNFPNADIKSTLENQNLINSFRILNKKAKKKIIKTNDKNNVPPIIPINNNLKLITENKIKTRNLEGLHKRNKSDVPNYNDSNSKILNLRSIGNYNVFDNGLNKFSSQKVDYEKQITEESKISNNSIFPLSEELLKPIDIKRSLGSKDLFNKVFSNYIKTNTYSVDNEKIVNCLAMDDFQRIFANAIKGSNKILPLSTQNKNSNHIEILTKKSSSVIRKSPKHRPLHLISKPSISNNQLHIENYKY